MAKLNNVAVSPMISKSEKNSKMKSKKRKLRSPHTTERHSKSARLLISLEAEVVDGTKPVEKLKQKEVSRESEEICPWKNLELIFLIQNKELDQQKKVEAVFSFVNSKLKEKDTHYDTLNISRLVIFLSDWIQSLLISSVKKEKNEGGNHHNVAIKPCLDCRCWEVFKFCLNESVNAHIPLNLSKNLLHAFWFVTKNSISLLAASLSSKEELFVGDRFKLYNFVLDCVSLVFSPHLGLSNENLDAWISTIDAVLEFLHEIYVNSLEEEDVGIFAIKFSCMMLEPFAKFLWIRPTKKIGFSNFINKLLEPLLLLLHDISPKADGCNHCWTRTLMKLLEEVLSHALFHTVHIDGFLCLHGSEKVIKSHDEKSEEPKAHIKSYHRHLFDEVQKLVAGNKLLALGAIGELFRVLVVRVKKVKGAAMMFEDTKLNNKMSSHAYSTLQKSVDGLSEKSHDQSGLSTEIRKSLFEFFIQILDPLLQTIEQISAEIKLGTTLSDVYCLLKSINNLLASFMKDFVYLRTEDNSEGAYHNFLKRVYDTVILVSSHFLLLSRHEIENNIDLEVFVLAANEILVTLGFLLEIEYDVIGNDLVSLWLVILSYSAINLSFTSTPKQHLLTYKMQELGCQLVVIYGQLRQVNISIFALCKAMRTVISNKGETEKGYASFMTTLGHEAYGKSVGVLLSSQEIKFAIHKAIKNIPEGQASGIIQQLTEDVTETLGWLRLCNMNLSSRNNSGGLNMQTVLLGRGLSEVYALMLDSLMITSGNAFQVGTSIGNLVSVIRPCMSSVVELQSDGAKALFAAVMGETCDDMAADEDNCLRFGVTGHWVFVFFFRLYMACRSLYMQAISLMPPSSSRKMSTAIGDSFIAYSACDWMQRTDWSDDGYFSWIIRPSASVLVVVQSVCNFYPQNTNEDWYPLMYVLLTMALQRLVDLNKQIGSLEYLHQRNENLMQVEVLGDDGLSVLRKKSKKFVRLISVLRKEAEDLTDFMMKHLSSVAKCQVLNSTRKNAASNDKSTEMLNEFDDWDFSICNVNKRSFPTAVWWIFCQNVDIWATHAAKKKLKMFLCFLIRTSHHLLISNDTKVGKQQTYDHRQLKKVSLQQISSAVLSDPIFYEHRFVCRFMPSRFCRELDASLLLSIHDTNTNSADWMEVIATLERLATSVCSSKRTPDDKPPLAKAVNHSSGMLHTEDWELKDDLPQSNLRFRACQHLINLLCWMPKGNISSRSFSLYTTCVLKLERQLVSSLLDNQTALCSSQFELLKLFASCRKALKYIFMAYYEAGNGQSSSLLVPSENHFPVSWLFKSLSIINQIQEASPGGTDRQIKDITFSLMDHTSYLFLTTSKYQFKNALSLIVIENKPSKEQQQDVCHELNDGDDLCLDSARRVEACNSAIQMSITLKEQVESELISLKKSNVAVGDGKNSANMCKVNSLASCLNGFLWGLVSATDHTDLRNGNHHMRSMKLKREYSSQLNLCMNAISELLGLILETFLDRDSQRPTKLCDYQTSQDLSVVNELSLKRCNSEADTLFSKHHELESSHCDEGTENANTNKKRLKLKNKSSLASILNEDNSIEMQSLNQLFLGGLLKGSYPEVAFALKQIFLAASVILRLHKQYDTIPPSSSLTAILIGLSRFLLLEFVNMVEVPEPFLLACFDGVLKYLEELGHLFPCADPMKSRNLYSRLINLHLKALGKCISLQGKRATLASHQTESTTKTLDGGLFEEPSFPGVYCMDEFKASLRMSFKVFIMEASELHLLSAIQAIERALVGVHEGCTSIYELYSGSEDGGRCSSIVAAGIECLDLVLEFVSGRKCLGVVKTHIQSLIAGLFSIVLHLQSPQIFYVRIGTKNRSDPDPGSVILMSVEVLTRVSGKHALFQMDAWHVSQCLRIPAALFEDFSLQLLGIPVQSDNSLIAGQEASNIVATTLISIIDRQFLIDLFAACCRLIYTVLKHHKSECKRSIAQLQASVSALLHSLERVGPDSEFVGGYFSWKVEEGVKCACFLRRIYEEIRQQREFVGRHCSLFLSNYIWVYSGHGPLRSGIRREIDEALRPGIYALVDACSAEDLQYLHTVFGEGPCRNTLATLQQDYKQFFQYEGKV